MHTSTVPRPRHMTLQSVFGEPNKPLPQVGNLVQLHGWPANHWAEVIKAAGTSNGTEQFKLVRYSDSGDFRYTQVISLSDVAKHLPKFDIPPTDFIAGSVDVVDGKLGCHRRRWPTKIHPDANTSVSAPERFH